MGDTKKVKDTAEEKDSLNNDETPQETLERVYGELNNVLKDELLTRIHEKSPDFFEKMVVELMERWDTAVVRLPRKAEMRE